MGAPGSALAARRGETDEGLLPTFALSAQIFDSRRGWIQNQSSTNWPVRKNAHTLAVSVILMQEVGAQSRRKALRFGLVGVYSQAPRGLKLLWASKVAP